MKLVVDERGTAETRTVLASTRGLATCVVSYVESRAALARMNAGGRIDAVKLQRARQVLGDLWLDLLTIPADDVLLARAADLADAHSLRGYDAVQLAAARSLQERADTRFVCWDDELNRAADRLGLALGTADTPQAISACTTAS